MTADTLLTPEARARLEAYIAWINDETGAKGNPYGDWGGCQDLQEPDLRAALATTDAQAATITDAEEYIEGVSGQLRKANDHITALEAEVERHGALDKEPAGCPECGAKLVPACPVCNDLVEVCAENDDATIEWVRAAQEIGANPATHPLTETASGAGSVDVDGLLKLAKANSDALVNLAGGPGHSVAARTVMMNAYNSIDHLAAALSARPRVSAEDIARVIAYSVFPNWGDTERVAWAGLDDERKAQARRAAEHTVALLEGRAR